MAVGQTANTANFNSIIEYTLIHRGNSWLDGFDPDDEIELNWHDILLIRRVE